MKYLTISVEEQGTFLWCKLNRPDVRNAFNPRMIEELTHFANHVPEGTRAVVLHGEGPVFCAGGDLRWMQESLEMTREQNFEDATRLAHMYLSIDRMSVPVIGIIHGASMGGGAGLVCVCDFVIATQETQFSFSEVRLGIVPACIAPFVLRKIGPGHARALFTTAERFSAGHAYEIGMVHQIAADREEAKSLAETKLKQISECGPNAVRYAKNLVFELLFCGNDQEQLKKAAELLATVRVSAEGQEGLRAFLEKRKPEWNK